MAKFAPAMSRDLPWLTIGGASILLTLHVRPGAKRTEVAGVHGGALKVRLAAPPVDGKANAELIGFLAEQFGVPERNVELLGGRTGRNKRVRITGATKRPDAGW